MRRATCRITGNTGMVLGSGSAYGAAMLRIDEIN
jgi:hypothetical protein